MPQPRRITGLVIALALVGAACSGSGTDEADLAEPGALPAPGASQPPDTRTPEQIDWCTRLNQIPLPPTRETLEVMDVLIDEIPTEEWIDDTSEMRDLLAARVANPTMAPIESDPEAVAIQQRFWQRCVYLEEIDREEMGEMQDRGLIPEEGQPGVTTVPEAPSGPTTTADPAEAG